MSENLKYRREMIFKVLAWGAFVLLLVWGYSLTQSNSFELWAPYEENFLKFVEARNKQADHLDSPLGSTHDDRVKAAQIRLDNHLAKELRQDSQDRALGLICGALFYCIIYPLIVWGVYKRTALGIGVDIDVAFPLKHALIFAIGMSVATFITAFLTAWN